MVDQIFEHLPGRQQRHPPQVKAIAVDQIEGLEHRAPTERLPRQSEIGAAGFVEHHSLAAGRLSF